MTKIIINLIGAVALALVFLTTIPTSAHAQIIRDTEIENALRLYATPIIEEAGLNPQQVKIHIINNDSLNAFVSQGQQIFITSGTLTIAEKPDEVIAVIAHEVGHIAAGHLASLHEQSKISRRAGIATALIGIPLAIAGGQAGAAIGSVALGQRIAQGSLVNYTQGMESSADQAAISYLHAQNISAKGMLTFLERLKKLDGIYGEQAVYLRTHPLTNDRIAAAQQAIANEHNTNINPAPKALIATHNRIRAKLIGYLQTHRYVLKKFPIADTSDIARYARAFSYMRKGQQKEALREIDALLGEAPDDTFFLEAKGDIYRNFGQMKEARSYYSQALAQAPWAALIRSRWANSITYAERENAELVADALEHARLAIRAEPRLYPAWQAKAALEAARGESGLADIAGAEASLLRGDLQRAEFLAARAADKFGVGSHERSQAEDILHRTNQIKNKR